ncbi:uncharacterized protein BKCO1_700065 [Diplodia corticola]|uniref:Uncharacterized protein n=1 Tax=Diplodia corticola TaxID=236234 RepID=A0A1J9R9X1_9PEZI|nr:uncharacterized protein BKCO1_700065 [Diplodia corticola]OJD37336.1 hypothetical protein BKCO1_700065 [Diplodia corticola]
MTVVATKLQDLTKSVDPFGVPPERMGTTRIFWQFIKTADVRHLAVGQLLDAVEDEVVAAIGMPDIQVPDILRLPRPSQDRLKKFGNYVGVVELPDQPPMAYVGSSCNKSKGMAHRWRSYESNIKTGTNPGKMAFVDEMLKPGAENHIRALFTVDGPPRLPASVARM